MQIRDVLFTSLLLTMSCIISNNAMADDNDILSFIDKQVESKEKQKKQEDEKITISKKELLSIIEKNTNNNGSNKDTKKDTNKSTSKQVEKDKIVKEFLKKQKDIKKEKDVLSAIQEEDKKNSENINNNQIDDSQYQSQTKKYGGHMNLGAALYYNPYNKKGLDIGLSWDLYYRPTYINESDNDSNGANWALLTGVDGILHNSLSNWGGYRQFKSEIAGEDGKIRERYTILCKLGFMVFHNDNWSSLWYFLVGWTQSTIHVWNNIEGGSNSKKTTYMRAGFGFKVVYKKIYLSFSFLLSSPELYYINNDGTKILYNTDSGTKTPHTNGEHNILFGFGFNFL